MSRLIRAALELAGNHIEHGHPIDKDEAIAVFCRRHLDVEDIDLIAEALDLADVFAAFGRVVRRSEPQRIPQVGDRSDA